MAGSIHMPCPLCAGSLGRQLSAHSRRYVDCAHCRLVHLEPALRISEAEERAEYALHRNDPADPGYRRFLGRLAGPLVERLAPGSTGLDLGSGPAPTLSVMLEELGHTVRIYDPFFAPDRAVLNDEYDFVTCTEVAEHFFEPGREFERMFSLVRPGGLLAVMTEVLGPERDFATWHYPRELSHVCFYRWETFEWLAARHRATLSRPHPNVAFFQLASPS
ncbi:MAG TPA: class I SAM-dependent methyltransferase [Polyangiaceae bacterium]|nr:class I SAM-dependent methyltransferase [Polyangiaceae bacterium]